MEANRPAPLRPTGRQKIAGAADTTLDPLLGSRAVTESTGPVSLMTIHRWTKDPRVAFPLPDVIINGRRYWYASTIRRWRADRAAKAVAKLPGPPPPIQRRRIDGMASNVPGSSPSTPSEKLPSSWSEAFAL
jgi:hypothetical protein